jgi:hypothetical protein
MLSREVKWPPGLPVVHRHVRVKDDAVARAFEETRGDKFNRGTTAHFTWSGRSKYVKVAGVHAKTTSARSKIFRLELEIEESPQDHLTKVSIGGKSPADLTESALRTVLFGERNPQAGQCMEFATEINDPLA